MEFGVQFFPSASSMSPMEFAVAAEERGFESVFFPDHTHVPTGRDTPWPSGGELPDYYRRVMDPIVCLGAAAAVTRTIGIGTAICLVVERDPIILAKQIASLDQLTGGRVLLGVGAGWNEEEMRNHGTDPATRFTLLRERIEAMTAIWTEDEPAYRGRLVRFAALWSWPKPVRRPRPPVLLGGWGPKVLDRVVAYADGWLPYRDGVEQVTDDVGGDVEEFEADLADRIKQLQVKATERGRGPMPVTLFNPKPHRDALRRYADMGVARGIFWLPTAAADELYPLLDGLAHLVSA